MKVKWGVIAAGGIADRRTIPGMMLAGNAELVSVMDINMELAEKIKMKYNAKRAYDNVDSLLADSDIDAVYIASPVIFHKEQAIKAARAKKHILIEKPVAITSTDGKVLLEICRKEGITIAVGFMMRYHVYHQKMKEIVESGRLGKVVTCRCQSAGWYPDMPGNWRQLKSSSGGGALMDMGVHCIDLIQYISRSKAIKVTAFTDTKTFSYDVEDSASVIFEMDNGGYSYIDANFNIPNEATKSRFEIYGTRGSLIAEGTIGQVEGGKLNIVILDESMESNEKMDRVVTTKLSLDVELGNMYTKEIESFSNSILKNSNVEVSVEDALQVQEVVEAAYESSQTGRIVLL